MNPKTPDQLWEDIRSGSSSLPSTSSHQPAEPSDSDDWPAHQSDFPETVLPQSSDDSPERASTAEDGEDVPLPEPEHRDSPATALPLPAEAPESTATCIAEPPVPDTSLDSPSELASTDAVAQSPMELTAVSKARRLDSADFPDQPAPGSKRVLTTIDNVGYVIARHGIVARYDVIKKKTFVSIPGHRGTSDNLDNSAMTYILSLCGLNGMSTGQVPAMINYLADRNACNPVADWINSKPWDGQDRLPAFFDTVQATEDYPESLKNVLLYKWLLSATAAAVMPAGFKCRGVLTLQGPQGIGKTSWGTSLVTDPVLREQVVKVDHMLDSGNKDSILGAVSHWICEIGELESSIKKDVARLKGFLTGEYDKIRRPYARTESEYQRRTVFYATVNDPHFLVDQTGNSRWWTIAVKSLNYKHGIDMQQLYAQLAVDFHKGKEWWLTQSEESFLDGYNRANHRQVSVIRELLEQHLDLDRKDEPKLPRMLPIEVLRWMGIERPTNPQAKECGTHLREMLGAPKRVKGYNVYRIPKRVDARGFETTSMDEVDTDDDY